MKTNLTRSLFIISLVLTMLSCGKESIEIARPDDPQTPDAPSTEVGTFVFTAGHEVVDIKSNLNSDLVPYWVAGDAIGVTTSTDANVRCDLLSADEGTFDGSDIQGGAAPYYAVYPYDETNTYEGSVITASVPDVQIVPSGQCVASGALVSACISSDTQLTFRNCVSLLKLEIPANIKQVVVSSTGENEYLTGKFTMDMSASDLVAVLPESDPSLSNSVTLKPDTDTFAAGAYYIAVIPANVSGFSLTFTNGKDETVTITKKEATSLVRSSGINFGPFSLPLYGCGVRYGDSVSVIRYFKSIFPTTSFIALPFLKVTGPEIPSLKPSLINSLAIS